MSRRLPLRFDRLALRTRMMLVSGVAVVIASALVALLIVLAVRDELRDTVDDVGEFRAERVAEMARRGALPSELVVAGDLEAAVQVVRDRQVVSATPRARGRDFFALPQLPPGSREVLRVAALPLEEEGPFRVTALGTRTPEGNATVFVAVDVEDMNEVVDAMVQEGAVGLALLVLAVGGVLWVVVGRTLGSVEVIRSRAELITGLKQLDRRVPEPAAKDEIQRLARTINDMLERLEGSAKRQERFVADAAHELRTPLATLRARLETALLRGGADADDLLLLDLLDEAVRMSSLVDQLLLLARSDAGMARAGRPVDLDDVLREVISSTEAGDMQVRVIDIQPAQVVGEPAMLAQVVRNLVENAVRHADGTVEVSLASDAREAVLTVDDDGPGIAPEARAEVFRRFVRLDDSRSRKGGGVGLGLAIVAEILRVHSGTVEVADSPAHGARMRVRLPLSDSARPSAPPRERVVAAAVPRATAPSRRG